MRAKLELVLWGRRFLVDGLPGRPSPRKAAVRSFTRPAGVELNVELDLALLIGPVEGDGLSDEDLAAGWHFHGAEVMDGYRGPAGTRPWGWWRFVAGEEMPSVAGDVRASRWGAEAVRLAELGELTGGELAALHEAAVESGLRVGSTPELISDGISLDARRVELYEAVEQAFRQQQREAAACPR